MRRTVILHFQLLAYTARHSERGCDCRQDADGNLQHHLPCVSFHSLSNLKVKHMSFFASWGVNEVKEVNEVYEVKEVITPYGRSGS